MSRRLTVTIFLAARLCGVPKEVAMLIYERNQIGATTASTSGLTSRNRSGGVPAAPRPPRAPDSLTAETSAGPLAPAIGACRMGCWICRRSSMLRSFHISLND